MGSYSSSHHVQGLYAVKPGSNRGDFHCLSKFTHSTVIKEVQQWDKESPPVLPVPSDHCEEVGAECRVGLILSKASYDGLTRHINGLLQIVWHLHSSNCLHLRKKKEKCYEQNTWDISFYIILAPNIRRLSNDPLQKVTTGLKTQVQFLYSDIKKHFQVMKWDHNYSKQLTWMNPVYFLSISTSCWSALFLMLGSGSVPIAMR